MSETVFYNKPKKIYRKYFTKDDVLIGAILMGYVDDGGLIGSLIRSRTKIDPAEAGFDLGRLRYRLSYLPH